jgi:hypothetical protein
MSIDIDATYRDGAIHPDVPLNLPDNTPVRVRVVSKHGYGQVTKEEILATRPESPSFTAQQLDALIDKYNIAAPSLPVDFSRADIYSDRD